jgi:hypothetical protein
MSEFKTKIAKPKFVALDSSHLGAVAADKVGSGRIG